MLTPLGEFKDDAVAAALIEVVQAGDASYFVEAEAAAALGKTRRDSALAPLQQAVDTSSWNETIRNGVFRGLAELQDRTPFPCCVISPDAKPDGTLCRIRAWATGWKRTRPRPIVETLPRSSMRAFSTRMAVLDAWVLTPQTLPALNACAVIWTDGVQRRVEEVIRSDPQRAQTNRQVRQLRDDFHALREKKNCSTASTASSAPDHR